MILRNNLEQAIRVTKSINDNEPVPAGRNGRDVIEHDDDPMIIDYPFGTDNLKVIIDLEKMPSKNQIEGVKIIPGSIAAPHHVEFKPRGGTKYAVVLHYKDENNGGEKFRDVDPTVEHPEGSD